jgi:DNA-binding transcriptional LysR family regulator
LEHWDEIRTAYQVAKQGTVSGAADVLGVHHATVIRHIDALEARLGAKLFQRHARGYTPTEAGHDLLRVAGATDDQFQQLAGRIRGQGEGVIGDLVVTSLPLVSHVLTPILVGFQQENPGLHIRYLTSDRLFRLEYGEAHVAIRAGTTPQEPDNVVQLFGQFRGALVASDAYVSRHGMPKGEADLANHWFVANDATGGRAPWSDWIKALVGADRIIFRTSDDKAMRGAIQEGAGLGFVANWEAENDPSLHRVLPSREEWSVRLWLVTHVDLHRTPKVQGFLHYLKSRAHEVTL